ncbi:hypothetical protein STSP_51590 [Streptomyces jeddahensis]|uniref:Uncharacterized protein n=1 Tax=Streptomyces jeddahensis TaxID=1716141 RepID=A0A177HL31_9ACTN|nr:hypothetical protein STSP_51590 [Streptomyces jeddahensis]
MTSLPYPNLDESSAPAPAAGAQPTADPPGPPAVGA